MKKLFFIFFCGLILFYASISSFSQNRLPKELVDSVMNNDRLACYFDSLGDTRTAYNYAAKNVNINKMLGETSVPYSVSLLKLARYEKEIKANNEITKRGLAILKDSLGTNSSIYINYLLEYAWRLFNDDQTQKACNTIKVVAEEDFNDNELFQGYLYYSYAHFLKKAEEYDQAMIYAKKAESFFIEKELWSDANYSRTLMDLGLLSLPNKELSYGYFTRAKDNIEKYEGKDCIDYLDVLLDIAYLYRATNQLEEALYYAKQANETGEKIKELDYGSYLYTLDFLAGRYSSLHQYSEAIKYAEKCLTLMKESNDFDLEDRLATLDSLVVYNWNISNIEKTNLFAKEAYLIRKSSNIAGEDMVRNLFYLLHSNYFLGKYEECEFNLNETKAIYGDAYPTSYKHYYDDMALLKNSFIKRKMYKESLDVSKEVYSIYMQQFGNDSEFLAELLKDQAYIYTYLGDFDNYHVISIKALEMKKRLYGENSTKYIVDLSSEAYHFYNIGFLEDSYNMYKESATIAKQRFGEMHILFVINYLPAIMLWTHDKGELFDDYKIENLYRYMIFKRLLHGINNTQSETSKWLNDLCVYLRAGLPNLLIKYLNDKNAYNAIYNCLLLQKIRIPLKDDLINNIKKELGQDSAIIFEDFCKTNSLYLNVQANSEPATVDSLYKIICQSIGKISKKSISFESFYKGSVTVEDIKNHLLDKEVIIDYINQKQIGDSLVDYLVIMDKKREYPDFVPVENISEQIKQISASYTTTYFFNDSILTNLIIDINKTNCIIGYDLSIEHIMNRGEKKAVESSGPIVQTGMRGFTDECRSAYKEFEKGINLYNKKQYELAIDAFIASDSLMYKAKGDESNFFGHGMQWVASCYFKMGNVSVAKQYSDYYALSPIDMRSTMLSDSILDVAASLYNNGEIEAALNKFIEASEVEKKNLGRFNYWYANTISHCADLYKELGKYEKAIEYETEALNIRKKSPGVNHIDYYSSLKNLFLLASESGNKNEKIKYGELLVEFMEDHRDILELDTLDYPLYTTVLAKTYAEDNNHMKSLSFCKKTIESADSWIDYPETYTLLFHEIIMTLEMIGEDSIAFELCKHIIPIYEKDKELLSKEHENYVDILNTIANHYNSRGDYISTCVYQEKALFFLTDKSSPRYGTTLSNLSLTYCELGRIDEAIKIAKDAVAICEKDTLMMMDSKSISVYATRLTNLAHCYAIANKPKDALRIGKKSYAILMDEFGGDNRKTMVAANNLASYYDELGYIDESRKLLLSVIDFAQEDVNKYGDVLGTVYNNLGMNWSRKQLDFEGSLKYINKSYEIRKKVLGEQNLYTIQSLYNKGRCLLDIGEISEGVRCITIALSQTRDLIGDNNPRYVEMMKILIWIYANVGNLDRALSIAEKRVELLNKIVGEYHVSYLKSIEELSELYFYTNDTLSLHNTLIETSTNYRKMVISDFPNYTSTERANVVSGMERFFDWLFPLVCYYNQQAEMCSELYDALLLRKGILLNSEIEFGRLIRESGDSLLISRNNELIANKNLLNRQYQLPIEQRIYDVDSLRHVINEEEDHLVSASKEYGDYTKRFRTNWKDIRDKLKDGELSVEFVEFYDTCAIQNRLYYALVVNKYSVCPELVPLCMEQQINDVIKSNNSGGVYQLIWNPILQKSKNVNTLFFSPAGILNNIGIEYVNINEHENISDKYEIYRLSSTREIVENQKTECKSAALYGGLDYSVDSDVLLAQNARAGIETNSSVMYRGLSDSLSVRNSFEPLYNTKTEISEIDKTLKKGNVVVFMYSDTFGTEESFKALSGKGMNLIHLATHGMYIDASEAESKKRETNLSFIQLDDHGGGQIQEDKSLSRSFLVMSGGDMLPSHKEVPDNLEDGILTASEISKLDLRGLDLVVLSACQTALGDVNNEGVYGLQRGFKKAGANTILMSLDKVDDEATRILMVEFYKNLMAGKSKHQSLKDAQQYLRTVENGKYDDSKYWASFVMLDGLN